MTDALTTLNARRSVPARQLGEPGPDAAQLEQMLRAAVRVPDHGKLTPWRMILLQGEAKLRFGEQLADLAESKDPGLPDSKRRKNRERYTFAPLVVAVVCSPDTGSSVPEVEQLLSAGCVCHTLLQAAQALGFGAQWLTGWAAYDTDVYRLLGLAAHERVVGFVHVGTPRLEAPERDRPEPADRVSTWTP